MNVRYLAIFIIAGELKTCLDTLRSSTGEELHYPLEPLRFKTFPDPRLQTSSHFRSKKVVRPIVILTVAGANSKPLDPERSAGWS